MYRAILLYCALTFVKGEVSFTKISYTTKGQPCLTDCKNNMCITGWNLAHETCVSGTEPAPIYYTAQTQEKTTCLSRCGKFGYAYNWCLVSNDLKWDYCSPEVKVNWKRNQKHSLHYGPCIDECKKQGSISQCTTHGGYTDECDATKEYNYVEAKTVYGLDCLGECKQHKGYYNYYWCYDANLNVNNCAPPASPPSLNIYAKALDLQKKLCESKKVRGKRCAPSNKDCGAKCNPDSAVLRMASALEKSDSFLTKHIEEYRNPIYSYTVKPSTKENEPLLPLVIRANITSDSIRPSNMDLKTIIVSKDVKNNVDLMSGDKDVAAFLIGFKNGGPADIFNLVPQSKSTYKSWVSYGKTIYDWIQQDIGNKVEVTIVVVYENNVQRPSSFGLSLLFKNNGTMCKEPEDQILYNGKATYHNKKPRKPSPPVKVKDSEMDLEYLLGLF